MLTRIEADGFKSLDDFALDLAPFTVILGPNASGKSNLFDALRFLSALASMPVVEAAGTVRGLPHELFAVGADGSLGQKIRLAAELLLDRDVLDPFGDGLQLTQTRVRYEVELERVTRNGLDRVEIVRESATPILSHSDRWHPYGRPPSPPFRQARLQYRRKSPFLQTQPEQGALVFTVKQDGHQGRDRRVLGSERTLLSTMTDSTFPHLYAVRAELAGWFGLQLEPTAMHAPASVLGPDVLSTDGSNVARVLLRLQGESPRTLHRIVADMAEIVEGVRKLEVTPDSDSRTVKVTLRAGDGAFSSRVLSDGTLRLLALFTLLHDSKAPSVLFLEEPENGVHPVRLEALVRRLRSFTSDPEEDDGTSLRQILVNSHSPVVLNAVRDFDGVAVFFDTVIRSAAGGFVRRTRSRPVFKSEQLEMRPEHAIQVSSAEVQRVLATVSGGV